MTDAGPPRDPERPRPPRSRPGLAGLLVAGAGALIAVAALSLSVMVSQSAGSNGEWSRSGAQILAAGRASLLSARSVHLSGTVVTGLQTDVYDITEGPHSAVGRITADGAPLSLRVVGEDVYLQGRQFFTTLAGPEAGARIGERWVRASLDDPQLARFAAVRLSSLAGLFTTAGHGGVDKGATSTRNGVTLGTLRVGTGAITVALDGAPYPQSLSATVATEDAEARVAFTLSGYDIPLPEVTAPGVFLPFPAAPST
ncbi:MAG TPA: hypothetical protein VGP96_04955 [Candidatus Dormibacteraeota bacterium]|jgi:hypothetical protein|nr:hypothetical protein [Candidatus Dormibacteraeota bacterium]